MVFQLTFQQTKQIQEKAALPEKKEFLTKEIDPDDNRKKIIKITSKGKEIQKFAIKTNEEIENKLNPQIGEKEMADLKIKLEELIILIDS